MSNHNNAFTTKILSKETYYIESHERIGFLQNGSLALIDNNADALEEKCSDDYWADDNDTSVVRAGNLQEKTEFIKYHRDGSMEVEAFYPRSNGETTVVRYTMKPNK